MTQPFRNGRCGACKHVSRVEMELALAGGVSVRATARKFAIPYDQLSRHWKRHVDDERKSRLAVGPVQRAALAARVSEENSSVLDSLKIVRAGLYQQFDAALAAGDRQTGALLAGRLHENLRITAGITGELASSPLISNTTINNNTTALFESPRFRRFEQALLTLATAHPELHPRLLELIKILDDEDSSQQPPALEHQRLT